MAASSELSSLRIERVARPPTKVRRGRWWQWPLLVLGLLLLIGACRTFLVVPQVTVAPAVRTSIQADGTGWGELTAAGYIVADRRSTVSAKYTTRLARLLAREATVVEKGQLLAELDHRELDAMIVEAEADVARARAGIEQALANVLQAEAQAAQARDGALQATAELAAAEAAIQTAEAVQAEAQAALDDAGRRQRIEEALVKTGSLEATRADDRRTEIRLTQARATAAEQGRREAVARAAASRARVAGADGAIRAADAQANARRAARGSADAALLAAQARVETLRARLDDHFIRAPFAGVVTERIAEEGEIVAPVSVGGTQAKGAIVTVIESASLQAEVEVTESHLARVKPGGRARLTVDALPGEIFPGTVQRILPLVDRGKATVKTRVDFRAVDPRFLLDMAVRVRFLPPEAPAGAEEGLIPDPLAVPSAAVVARGGQSWVWIVTGDRAYRTAVTTGAVRDGRTEIAGGLDEGAAVVVAGVGALRRDGQRVKVHRAEGRR